MSRIWWNICVYEAQEVEINAQNSSINTNSTQCARLHKLERVFNISLSCRMGHGHICNNFAYDDVDNFDEYYLQKETHFTCAQNSIYQSLNRQLKK